MQIFLLGDSLAQGIIFDKARARLTLTRDSFYNMIRPIFQGEIVNLSKLGRTLSDARKTLEQRLKLCKPEAVAIELGGNDCDFDWDAVALAPDAPHKCKTPFDEFERGIRDLVQQLKSEGIIPVLFNLPPIDADRFFHHVCHHDPENERRVLSFLGSVTRIYWWHERFSSVIGQIADDMNTMFIDIRRAFLHHEDYRVFLCDDGMHPNAAGHILIAEQIQSFLSKNYAQILVNA